MSKKEKEHRWPLMVDETPISVKRQVADLILKGERLTQSRNVKWFESLWNQWLGIRESVFVNSGSSANYITFHILRDLTPAKQVICSPLGWVSDYAAILNAGFQPLFVDIDPFTLGLNTDHALNLIGKETAGVLVIHVQGFNALTSELVEGTSGSFLIEDCCEAHGATFEGRKVGTVGDVSNFSFYFAHHLSTVEGGMVSTNNEEIARRAILYRSHGMTRELGNNEKRTALEDSNPLCHPEFVFEVPGFNMRGTEISGLMGALNLESLNASIEKRNSNLIKFLSLIDPSRFRTDFNTNGMSSYALNLILREKDQKLWRKVLNLFRNRNIEFRRGSSGGGNQLRQPYLRRVLGDVYDKFPETEHVHNFGLYFGNYPSLSTVLIEDLCARLNSL